MTDLKHYSELFKALAEDPETVLEVEASMNYWVEVPWAEALSSLASGIRIRVKSDAKTDLITKLRKAYEARKAEAHALSEQLIKAKRDLILTKVQQDAAKERAAGLVKQRDTAYFKLAGARLYIRHLIETIKANNVEWKALADSGDAGNWKAEEQPRYIANITLSATFTEKNE